MHETNAVNALAHASSAYLRTAMHQPIQWHEWGEEAFAAAARENKPVLLDIGAVWCHWCHVMDRESYENPDVARIINENFIAVKVDRDERPDVDSRYQAAVQAISGQGGWPLTAFLTPEGKPFFGGTYFPPDDRFGRPGFKRVLMAIAQAFRDQHADVAESADSVMAAISHGEAFTNTSGTVSEAMLGYIVESARKQFDAANGGFGSAPKFPHAAAITLLIDQAATTGDAQSREIAVTTLRKMALGGIYDQLAGGFHRYSVDERWVVPHFEKMAYDNSELLKNYSQAFLAFGEPFFAAVARDILRWMDEWLSDRERGGFYASQDADYSLDDDGDYFTWTQKEAEGALTGDEYRAAVLHWDIYEHGEMHHNHFKNVLFVAETEAAIARKMNLDEAAVRALLDSAKAKMYAVRLQRPTPFVDKTVYVSWNALCISAYLAAAAALGEDAPRRFALRSLDRILAEGWNAAEHRLAHVIAYNEGSSQRPKVAGLLDDYAFTTLACLDAYEATGDLVYFRFARDIAEAMLANFEDQSHGGFFDAPDDPAAIGALSARRKPLQDAPTPAGNSMAAIALLRLHGFTNDDRYRASAMRTLEVFAGVASQFGIYAATYGIAVAWATRPHRQVVVLGRDARAAELERAARERFSLTSTVLRIADDQAVAQQLPPTLAETLPNLPGSGGSRAVVCANFACMPPITDPEELRKTLASLT